MLLPLIVGGGVQSWSPLRFQPPCLRRLVWERPGLQDRMQEMGRGKLEGKFSEGTSGFGALTAAVFREPPRISFSYFGKREV